MAFAYRAITLLAVASLAAAPSAPLNELGVDQVLLKHGERLLGAVIDRDRQGGLTIAVSRAWLKHALPRAYDRFAADEAAEEKEAQAELRERLGQWIARSADEKELLFFLQKELDRCAHPPEKPDGHAAPFMLLSFPEKEIERVYVQPRERKQAALVAWRDGLDDVENRSAASLANELQKAGIDPAKERVDLSQLLSVRRQSKAEWSARQAIVEYQYRNPVNLQGVGDLMVRTGEGAKAPDAGALLVAVLRSQLTEQLAGLFQEAGGARPKPDDNRWLDAAAREAERAEAAGFRATRLATDLTTQRVTVETRFVANLPGTGWTTIWSDVEAHDATKADPDIERQIAEDPQVARVLELTKAAGLGGGDDQIRQALRVGAATMHAQKAADARFFEFRDRYLHRLDGPPLFIGGSR